MKKDAQRNLLLIAAIAFLLGGMLERNLILVILGVAFAVLGMSTEKKSSGK